MISPFVDNSLISEVVSVQRANVQRDGSRISYDQEQGNFVARISLAHVPVDRI